jgi:transposase-like protein
VYEIKPNKRNIFVELQLIDYIMTVENPSETVCPNPECEYHHRAEGKAIIKRGKYKTGHQRYYCKHCGKFFMDTVGTAVYRKHLPGNDIRLIYRLFLEKNGIRSIERITGHHRDTISHLIRDTVRNQKMEEYLVKQIGLTACECEKLWATLEKKRGTSRKLP